MPSLPLIPKWVRNTSLGPGYSSMKEMDQARSSTVFLPLTADSRDNGAGAGPRGGVYKDSYL